MKKKLILASILLVTSTYANENRYFVSVCLGKAYETIKGTVQNNSAEVTGNATSFNINGGVFFDEQSRASIGFTTYSGANSTINSLEFTCDYFFNLKNKNLKPFIGAGYMLLQHSENTTNTNDITWDNSTIDLTTNILLVRIGVEHDINKNIYMSFLYDYALTKSGNTNVGFTYDDNHYVANYEITNASKLEFNIGYRF